MKITSQIFFTSDLTLKFTRHQKLQFYFLKQSLFTHNFWSNAVWSLWCCGLKVKQWVHQQRCNQKNHANLISQDIWKPSQTQKRLKKSNWRYSAESLRFFSSPAVGQIRLEVLEKKAEVKHEKQSKPQSASTVRSQLSCGFSIPPAGLDLELWFKLQGSFSHT